MNRNIVTIFLVCAGLLALACAETAPTWKPPTSTNKPRKHVMVQFTDMSLHPSNAQVLAGGMVSWVNYATEYQGTVVFTDEVADSFTCKELRPNWMKTGTGYQSIPIRMGDTMNDIQIPCPLKAGEYDYEIWLFSSTLGGPTNMDNPQSRIPGKIIVK